MLSFDLTREVGSKFSEPDELSESDSSSFLLRLLLLPGSESALCFLLREMSMVLPLPDGLLWCDPRELEVSSRGPPFLAVDPEGFFLGVVLPFSLGPPRMAVSPFLLRGPPVDPESVSSSSTV